MMKIDIFYIFLFAHIIFMVIGFGAVLTLDTFGALCIFKKVKISFFISVAGIIQPLIWLGWFGLVASGIGLLILKGSVDNIATVKLFLVAMLGINGTYLHFIKGGLESLRDDEKIPGIYLFRAGLASAVSQLGWWGALTIGFLQRHWNHIIEWPANPSLVILLIVVVISLPALVGEFLFSRKRVLLSAR